MLSAYLALSALALVLPHPSGVVRSGGQDPALHEASDLVATAPAPSDQTNVAQPVRAAIAAAVALPGASAEVLDLAGALPARCVLTRAEAPRPVRASGRVALHLFGRDRAEQCDGWAWARVRVSAPSLVTTRAVMEGAALEGAVAAVEREIVPGRPPVATLPEGAVADRALAIGVPLDETLFRIGARPGQAVAVVLRAGALVVEQRGQAIACRRGRACALLPTGRRVEGTWHDGRIQLEAP